MSCTRWCSLTYMGRLIYSFNVSVDGLHRRCARQHRLVRSERGAAPVLERLRAGDRPVVLRVAALRTDVRVLADRRPGRGRLESVDWNSRLERGDPVEVVTKLKAETDGVLEVAGATPFFPTQPSWISLRLLENRTFTGGTVLLRYAAKHD